MLKEFFVPELKRLGKTSSTIFQQDEAPPHFRPDVRQYLDKIFPNQRIRRDSAHQMGIIHFPLDLFLWLYVKNNIYKSPIRNLDELRIKIADKIETFQVSDVLPNLVKRCIYVIISVEGEHFEQLL